MAQRQAHTRWFVIGILLQGLLVACADDDGGGGTVDSVGGSTNASSSTKASSGGMTTTSAQGGSVSAQGGASAVQTSVTSQGGSIAATTTSELGGATAKGGSSATGGTTAKGGSSATGGTTAKGGSKAAGGTTTKGGSSATGGTTAKGGSSATDVGGTTAKGGASATGGTTAKGGASATGGTTAKGGASATGGTTATSTTNSNVAGPTKTCGCLTSTGNYSGNPLTASIVVDAGETYDGNCQTFITKSLASGGLGDGSQEEDQKPLFRVNGGTIKNVILGAPAADGIHFHGNATAQNIHWKDIGEDAATIKAAATVTMDCGSAVNGADKIFQVNAKATWNISNFTLKTAGKGMRENGGECYPVNVTFDHCDISDLDEVVFRTDCNTSKVTISNTRYSGLGDGLVMIGSTVYNASTTNVTITNAVKY